MNKSRFAKNLIGALLGSVILAGSVQAQNFAELSPSSQILKGIQYPRKNIYLYRGTSDGQLSFAKAASAMLGDKTANVESLFFSTIKNKLMQQNFALAVALNSYLNQEIQNKINANGGPLDLLKATNAAKDLVDKTYSYYKQQGSLVPNYINYRSSSYIDWPNDVVFTTAISPLAGTYGNRVIVFKEQLPRSLDLNFWNYVNNGVWYDHTRDVSEFTAFGYMPSTDILGFQIRTGSNKNWHSISYAIYKPRDASTETLLVFTGMKANGQLSTCLDFDAKNSSLYHCEFDESSIILTAPPLSSEKAKLAGIISLCTNDQTSSCSQPSSAEIAKYQVSQLPVNLIQEIQNSLKGLVVKNKVLRFLSPKN